MSHPESSLPEAWTERIWATMRAFYGSAFDRQWQCPEGVDPVRHVADLKSVWGRELRGFQQNPQAIAHALDHLPDSPPNLVQFKLLCSRRPDAALPALPAPKADPDRVREVVAQAIRSAAAKTDGPRAWAYRLRAREDAGEKLKLAQKQMWRAAIESTIHFGSDA